MSFFSYLSNRAGLLFINLVTSALRYLLNASVRGSVWLCGCVPVVH